MSAKLFKTAAIAALLLVMSASCNNRPNPFTEVWDTPYQLPPFDRIRTPDYIPALKLGMAEQNEMIEAITEFDAPPTFGNTVEAYENSDELLAKVVGVLFNLCESDGTDAMAKVEEKATPMLSAHEDGIFMNRKFYQRVKTLYDGDQSSLDREQQMVLKKLYQAFVRNGVGLDDEAQAELKEINTALASATQKFGTNLLAENNRFKKECGVAVSAYSDEMTSNPDRAFREKMFRCYSNRGNIGNEYDNKQLCIDILKLRSRKAALLGFKDFASYQLDDKMASDPATVDSFLDRIIAPAVAKARRETADMQEVMDEDIAAGLLPEGSRIEPWDWFYYAERVRARKYSLDESLTRPYFRLENVRDGAFAAARKLYGVNVEPLDGVPVYNMDVQAFKVSDSDGSLLGIFYTDYLPRPVKRGGAWMNNFRDQSVDRFGNDIRPVIVNVCSFTAPTDSVPVSLLTIDEVETLFHEFGHALHGFLTKCRYSSVSGTSVARDFVETFSQFNENWAFQPEVLKQYARHWQTGEVIPDSLVTKIVNSRKFNQGFMTTELCAASILDMKLHELPAERLEGLDIAGFEKEVCDGMGLIEEIIPRYRTTYFNHIFNSGYSAGYYSYLWSEVLDKDAFECFKERGLWNPEVALSFRRTFLEKGGSEEPMTLYRQFRGKDPDPLALIRARGLDLE